MFERTSSEKASEESPISSGRSRTDGRGFLIPLVLSLCVLAGCASSPKYRDAAGRSEPAPRSRPGGDVYQEGIASYYGKKFHGRRTACGERYDMYGMTAAHRTLPFGTIVEVENQVNGRKILVRINDRGPFVPGRILDLSKGAAQKLGMLGTGTAMVSIRVKKWGPE